MPVGVFSIYGKILLAYSPHTFGGKLIREFWLFSLFLLVSLYMENQVKNSFPQHVQYIVLVLVHEINSKKTFIFMPHLFYGFQTPLNSSFL